MFSWFEFGVMCVMPFWLAPLVEAYEKWHQRVYTKRPKRRQRSYEDLYW